MSDDLDGDAASNADPWFEDEYDISDEEDTVPCSGSEASEVPQIAPMTCGPNIS